ncbi:hypothetical protein BOTNAR_0013g00330 [Botryotinia narcissicola]|uniref:Uncharacterized protein n=1 Tax=Botryotinia narcissicola TaxID=278944 RepID=A0A4Z1J6N5_9HELO|nr:hypothetical protein BOTNAR_0013g00330 [Botryotinia narcissicola]
MLSSIWLDRVLFKIMRISESQGDMCTWLPILSDCRILKTGCSMKESATWGYFGERQKSVHASRAFDRNWNRCDIPGACKYLSGKIEAITIAGWCRSYDSQSSLLGS